MENLIIGTRLRSLRNAQKRTIQDIAIICGLSKSMVSKIETNTVVPSVATLLKLAKALGTTISVLMESSESISPVINTYQDAIQNITRTQKGYYIFPFSPELYWKKMPNSPNISGSI